LRSTVEFMQPNSAAISALAETSRLASTVTGGECVVVKIIPVFEPLRHAAHLSLGGRIVVDVSVTAAVADAFHQRSNVATDPSADFGQAGIAA
jgi:hypothetical protein